MFTRLKPSTAFGVFATLLVAATVLAVVLRSRAPSSGERDEANRDGISVGTQSGGTGGERRETASPAGAMTTSAGYADASTQNPEAGGPLKATPPRKLDPKLDQAMDAIRANSMAESYVQLLERGRQDTSAELEKALLASGDAGKQALARALERMSMTDQTRVRVRNTYESIR